MPSTVRQKLPAELWSHNNDVLCSQVFVSSEMQACPGLCDDMKQQPSNNLQQFDRIKKRHRTGKRKSKLAFAGGITDTLDDLALSERALSDSSCSNSVDFSLLSSNSDSDSNVDYSSQKECDAFAMDAEGSAPPPTQVPLPPMEWLKPTSKSPLTVGRSIQALMH